MKFCVSRLHWFAEPRPHLKPWWRFERTNWHHCTKPTGIIVQWLWWQFHLSWTVGSVDP
jgi:hypothetical protein